ncbi:MAG: glycosyl hydrolase family 28-related protein [Bacteroidota bacterium]
MHRNIRQRVLYLTLFLFCSFFSHLGLKGQTLPPDRRTDWQLSGLQEMPISPILEIDFISSGGIADGKTPNDALIQELLEQNADHPFVLYFPAGNYFFTQAIELPSNCILRGQSADASTLQFALREEDHLLKVQGTPNANPSLLVTNARQGDTYIRIKEPQNFQVGDYIKIFAEDSALITSAWAHYSTGQLGQIKKLSKDSLFLSQPLRRDFLFEEEARIVRFSPKTQVGIEQLQIVRLDTTDSQTSNIFFDYAANCWLSCVQSRFCNFAHVELKHSLQIAIKGSHFEQAHHYGNGGKAYGIMLHFATSSSLVYDNSFRRLRHAMILQAGANGNVLAYNYSSEPYWTEVQLPLDAAGDLVLHGNYPYANLFEGNVVQNIVIDNSHGINGPFNTFFRNRAELYGIFMNQDPASDKQNFLGNELPNQGLFLGNYILAGSEHFEFANNIRGQIKPLGEQQLPDKSLFLLHESHLSAELDHLPPIGPPNALNSYELPAQKRAQEALKTACSKPLLATTLTDKSHQTAYYPYAQENWLSVHRRYPAKPITHLRLYSLEGKLLQECRGSSLTTESLGQGLYLIQVHHQEEILACLKWQKK